MDSPPPAGLVGALRRIEALLKTSLPILPIQRIEQTLKASLAVQHELLQVAKLSAITQHRILEVEKQILEAIATQNRITIHPGQPQFGPKTSLPIIQNHNHQTKNYDNHP
jgi:hypothetical protein